MRQSKPLIIVLSRNYSTGLGIIRSLGSVGYTVDLIASVKKRGSSVITSCSKYVRCSSEVLCENIQGNQGEEIIEVLMKYVRTNKDKMVLFPTDDFTTAVIDINRDILEKYFWMPHTLREDKSCVKLMDKQFQGEIARLAGFLTPLEWSVSLKNEIKIPEDIKYPCFVKPIQSVAGHKTEMIVCNALDELNRHLLKMQQNYCDREVLIQEYLDIDNEYDLSGVCIDQEVIIPGVIEKKRIAKYERGVTMSGKMLPLEELGEEVVQNIRNMLKLFRYVGMFDMEIFLCGDKFYFNEINLRSGGPNFSYFLNGANLPRIFVEEIMGEKHNLDDGNLNSFGKSFVYEKVVWEDYIYGYLTKKELEKCIAEADFKLLDSNDDPKPGRCFEKKIRLSVLKNKVKILFNKMQVTNMNHMPTEKPKVMIVGRNYCNILTMVRALGEAGYDVEVLRVFKKKPRLINPLTCMKPDKYSKYVNQYYECIVYDSPDKILKKLLDVSRTRQKVFLLPTDDYTACVVDEYLECLKKYYVTPNIENKAGEISRLMDKNEQKRRAEKFNIPILHSVLIRSENGAFTIPENIQYPCFIKPNVSMNSTKAKMCKCEDLNELKEKLQRYSLKEDFEMLIEEYVDIKTEYSILGLSTQENVISPGLFKTIEGGNKERKGVALTGEIIESYKLEPFIKECNRFIQSLKYTGMFDVDLIETKTGEIYFIELNFRAGASTHVLTKSGINLPQMLADYMVKGIDINVNAKCKTNNIGRRFVSEKILLEEYVRSDIDLSRVKKTMSEADVYFIKEDQDMQPYKHFVKFCAVAMLMKVPYRIRDFIKKYQDR